MDKPVADVMAAALVGKIVGGWHLREYIGKGKSAVVFLAAKNGRRAALKIFYPDLVQRYGRDAQLKRIEREQALRDKAHPNLVRVLDGGESGEYLFVAMEHFESKNLAEVLREIPASAVRILMSQIAAAAKFLEDSSFVHRDIKPENIGIAPDLQSAKLLDLGVIRPLDLSSLTDQGDQLHFIGTLQYSPPELLFREEEHSVEGWRAVTFYQLGAVLHDLLMRRPLFEEFKNPYARLVRAVEREIPRIDAGSTDADLRLLAQNCLSKVPRQRLDTVRWEDFNRPELADPMDAARRKIAQRRVAATQGTPRSHSPIEDLLSGQSFALQTSIYSAVVSTCKAESLPRYSTQRIREPNPFLLRTLFEPSAKDGLALHFAVYCQGEVLDPATNLHELCIWACVSPSRNAVPAEPGPTDPFHSVKGTLIDQDVRSHVQGLLLLAYAEALGLAPTESNSVHWIRTESGS